MSAEDDGYTFDASPLARGAFGEVYAARTATAAVVVKRVPIPLPQRGGPPEIPINVFREWQALLRTDHENVVRALDVFPSGGHLCFAMEPMDGDLCALADGSSPPPPESVVKAIILRILYGLEHVHGIGIMHRDIKPGNVLIRSDGAVKLADFGLCRPIAHFPVASLGAAAANVEATSGGGAGCGGPVRRVPSSKSSAARGAVRVTPTGDATAATEASRPYTPHIQSRWYRGGPSMVNLTYASAPIPV